MKTRRTVPTVNDMLRAIVDKSPVDAADIKARAYGIETFEITAGTDRWNTCSHEDLPAYVDALVQLRGRLAALQAPPPPVDQELVGLLADVGDLEAAVQSAEDAEDIALASGLRVKLSEARARLQAKKDGPDAVVDKLGTTWTVKNRMVQVFLYVDGRDALSVQWGLKNWPGFSYASKEVTSDDFPPEVAAETLLVAVPADAFDVFCDKLAALAKDDDVQIYTSATQALDCANGVVKYGGLPQARALEARSDVAA